MHGILIYLFIYFWFVLFCFGTKHLDPYQEFGITQMTFKSITLYRPIIILRGTDMCYAKYISYIQHERWNILHNIVGPTKYCYKYNNFMSCLIEKPQ